MPDFIPASPQPITQSVAPQKPIASPDFIPFGVDSSLPKRDLGNMATSASTQAIPDSTTPSTADFVGRALNTVEQPFINIAAIPVQLGVAGANKLTGGNVPDPFANGINPNRSLTGETVPISTVTAPEGWLQKGGSALQIATDAAAPLASGSVGWGAIGAASGLGQSLQSGETNLPQILKDTLYGGIFSAGLGLISGLAGGIGTMEETKTGVTGIVKREIQQTDPELLSMYIDATRTHGSNIRALTPDAIAETELRKRANLLVDTVIPKAGEAVGAARVAGAKLPVSFVSEGGQSVQGPEAVNAVTDLINDAMERMTGHQLSLYSEGEASGFNILNYPQGAPTTGIQATEGAISKLPGRSVELSTSEVKQLENLDKYLKILKENPTVQTASDMLINIDNDIGKWSTPIYGQHAGNTPVEGVLRYARGAINRIIAPASPDIAAANSMYSQLKDLQAQIGSEAGNMGQNASLMMRRVISGDQAGDVIPILDRLDTAVSPYLPKGQNNGNLVQHAVIASWAKNTFGDPSTKTLLNQYFNKDVSDTSTIFGQTKYLIKAGMQRTLGLLSPDPAQYALSVARGEPQSMNVLARGIDKLAELASSLPLIKQFAAGLKQLGVTSSQIEGTSKTMFKVWLIQQLTSPKQPQPPQSGPNTFLPTSLQTGTDRTLTQ